MTAHKDLRRHPEHNSRIYAHAHKTPTRVDKSGPCFAGGPFRQTVRAAAVPDLPKPRSR